MSLPSIRECDERLRALADTAPSAEACGDALTIAKALLHWARNSGTPPTELPTLKVAAQSLGGAAPHLHRPSTWTDVKAAQRSYTQPKHWTPPTNPKVAQKAAKPKKEPTRLPAGMIYVEEICLITGLAMGGVWKAVGTNRMPRCAGKHGKRSYWPRAQIVAWVAERDRVREQLDRERVAAKRPKKPATGTRKSRAKDHGPQPEGTLTVRQICERLERTQSWIYQAMASESVPFPQPCGDWGPHKVWRIAEVEAWTQRRAAHPFKRGQRKPLGLLTPDRTAATTPKGRR